MTKETITLSIKRVLADRSMLSLMAALIVVGFVFCCMTGFSIQPDYVKVYSRYTSFGETHFYRNQPWQYLLSFVGFGVIVTIVHLSLMIKFHSLNRVQTARFIGWVGIAILLIAMTYALSVIRLGRAV